MPQLIPSQHTSPPVTPQAFIIESPDGTKLRFDGDQPPSLDVIRQAFSVYGGQAPVPKFDPNQPFTVVDTPTTPPAFDPSKPFVNEPLKIDLTRVAPPQNLSTNQFIAGYNGGGEGFRAPSAKEAATAFGTAGRMLSGALADIGETITGQPSRENFDAAMTGEPMPMTQEVKRLPEAAQIVEKGAQGLVESVPKLAAVTAAQAVGVPAPVAAGAIFGLSEEKGFDPVAGAIGAALPFVGKYSGEIAGAISQRFGVNSPTALNWIKGLAGTVIPAVGVWGQQEYEVSKLPPELQHQARVDMWANILGQAALGPMGVEFDHEGAANEAYAKALAKNPEFQNFLNAQAVANLNPRFAQRGVEELPRPEQPQMVDASTMAALSDAEAQFNDPTRLRSAAGVPLTTPDIDLSKPPEPRTFQPDVDVLNHGEIANAHDANVATTPIDQLLAKNQRRLAYERQVAAIPPAPEVPETIGQPRESAVAEAHRLGLSTIEQIRSHFSEAGLSREKARVIRDAAFPKAEPSQAAETPRAPRQRVLRTGTSPATPKRSYWTGSPAESTAARPSFRPAPSQRANVRRSIGTIAESPLSEVEAQSAIAELLGHTPQNIRFINDPAAPAGRVTMIPGEQAMIEVNLARNNSRESVQDVIAEELVHSVWEHQAVANARRVIEQVVTNEAVRQKESAGYSADVAPEEAANEAVRNLFREHSESGIFRRALNQIVLTVKQLFGATLSPREAALAIMKRALKNEPTTGKGERQAIQAFKSKKAVDEMTNLVDLDPEGKARIKELAGVQAGAFPTDIAEEIVGKVTSEPTSFADATEKKLLRPVANFIRTSDAPRDVRTITEPEARLAASNVVVGQHFSILEHRSKVAEALKLAEGEVAKAVEKFGKLGPVEARSRMLEALSEGLPDDYANYLKNVIATSGANTTLAATARSLIQRSTIKAGDNVITSGSIERALNALVDNPRITTGGDAKDIIAQLWSKGGKTGLSPEMSMLVFGGPDGQGVNGLQPALARLRNLPAIIDVLRSIKSSGTKAMQEIEAFKQNFNPSGKAVGVQTAMKRYAKLVMQARDADTLISTVSKAYAKSRGKLLGAESALEQIDSLLHSPEYQSHVASAADALGATLDGLFVEAGGEMRAKGPISNRDYIFSRVPTKEQEISNRKQAEDLLAEIGEFINNPASDPIKKRTWEAIGERVGAQWVEAVSSPMESKVWGLDVKAMLPWLRTQSGLFEQIGGRSTLDTRRNLQAVDAIGDLITAEERNENHGLARQAVLLAEAMHTFGLDPKSPADVTRFERSISNAVLGSWQHPGQIKLAVGDLVPFTNYRVNAELMRLLDAQFKFEQAIRKQSEHDIAQYGVPSRILDEAGGQKFRRVSVPVGAKTVARLSYDFARDFVSNNWRIGLEPAARSAQIEKLMAAIEGDPDMWRDFVLGLVRETSPEFKRGTEFDDAFRQLTAKARRETITADNFDELAEAVSPFRSEPLATTKTMLRDYVASEIGRYLDRFAAKVDAENNLRDVDAVQRVVFSSLRTDGSFLTPRGEMMVPGSLYQYSKSLYSDIAKIPEVARNIARARALESMNQVLSAFEKMKAKLEEELVTLETTLPKPTGWRSMIPDFGHSGRAEAMRFQENQKRMGEIRFTLPELSRRINAVRSEMKKASNTIQKWDEDLSPSVAQTASIINKSSTLQLLGSIGSVFSNLVGGIHLNDLVVSGYMRNWRNVVFSTPTMTAKALKTAVGDSMNRLRATHPKVANAMLKIMPFTNALAEIAEATERNKRLLMSSGIISRFDWANRRAAKAAVGNAGKVVTLGNESPAHLRAMDWLHSTPVLMLQERAFPRVFDNFINQVQAARLESTFTDLAAHAMDIGSVRTATGKALNPLDVSQGISPTELDMNTRQEHYFRMLFERAGTTLERILFDYYQRVKSAPEAERESVQFIADPAIAQAVIRSYGQLGNIVKETNSPSSFRGSSIRKIAGTLGSYSANLLDNLIRVVPVWGESGFVRQAGNITLFTIAAAALGITAYELRRMIVEAYTGKVSSQPSLANVAEHPLSGDASMYLLNAVSQQIPYLNLVSQNLFNTGTDRSMYDLANIVPLVGLFKDATTTLEKSIRTGDVILPLEEFASRRMPLYSPILNRIPPQSGEIAATNPMRALRAATPSDLTRKYYGGTGGDIASPSSRVLRSATYAMATGNTARAQSLLNRAVQMKTDSGISPAKALSQIRAGIAARSPEASVIGRRLQPQERQRILSGMTSGQAKSYNAGMAANKSLLSLLPPKKATFHGGLSIHSPHLTRRARQYRTQF